MTKIPSNPSNPLNLMTNHNPKLDHMDDAIKGRLHKIPFDMQWNRPSAYFSLSWTAFQAECDRDSDDRRSCS